MAADRNPTKIKYQAAEALTIQRVKLNNAGAEIKYKTLDRLLGALTVPTILSRNAILEDSRVRSMRYPRSPLKRPGHTIVYGTAYVYHCYIEKDTFPGRSRG